MATAPQLAAAVREEKGKGAARRARAAGQVPAVLYGHGTDPEHLLLPDRELAAILRANGVNAVVELDIAGQKQLALTKQVDVHPIRNYIEHVDLLIVKRGEKVNVEVAILIEGVAASGTLTIQDASAVEVEAEALHIPENIVVDVHNLPAGTNVTAADLKLPAGVELITDPETLVVTIEAAKTAAETVGEEADEEAAEDAAE
ncbi:MULTISPECIES: 50S ribosomal protein L25/general stress protein Ctc [Gordonia]|uniref:Large ribosomal subunit protein bL25 n=2 Tax=Gordonia TaxID=2053 RepID=L7LQ48_9ACTN|nr:MULTISPECIES: 50S ribosomal protein L25/general stress protein Ctc [Gordonia]AUH69749.1 50S ribosomal protein L25 [Gordonia sp. YC-JH1]KJR07588.1 50S ribosomal protein L25 [Gordonia sihwensis]KXT55720.1 50S ribosomal protein L25 [Gordonia sp. QH-12]MBY4571435.1 50S ribosomal protein L25/general stress protein Ctc [Gordonia sihwensis]WFN93660.1 50S ribosomal protein L25/general stress protein Ctc [Gordonia sihwensis]